MNDPANNEAASSAVGDHKADPCQPRTLERDRGREYERCGRCNQTWPKGGLTFCEAVSVHVVSVVGDGDAILPTLDKAGVHRAISEWDAMQPATPRATSTRLDQ